MDIGVENLLEASVKLNCSMETTVSALVLYHDFMRNINEVPYDKRMIAAAALNLGSRINEQTIDFDTIILLFFCISNKTTRVLRIEDPEFIILKKSLITLDYIMQRILQFKLDFKLAHQYIVPYLHVIFSRNWKVAQFSGEISNTCIRLINDFYMNKICLNYHADHITIACIDTSLYIYGLSDELEMIQPWYKAFCKDVDEVKIIEIQDHMLNLYDSNKKKGVSVCIPDIMTTTSIVSHREISKDN